jgi:hypothetical protein
MLKGFSQPGCGGVLLATYEGLDIDPLYIVPGVSTATVSIRDENALTVRVETRLYTGAGWVLIDSADMLYDLASNLIRRETLDGRLYGGILRDKAF